MEMEIVFPPKKQPNSQLPKFADLDTLQTQMEIAFIPKILPHQLLILALLDSSQMETEVAFKREK